MFGSKRTVDEAPPPAMLFGKRLVIVPNRKVPKDHIVFAVHPDVWLQTKDKLNEAFAAWKQEHP